jgi:CBS domain-containing protein
MAPARTDTFPAALTLAAATARDLMTPNPVSIREGASVAEAIALLTDRGLSAAPVIDEAGRPRGVITHGDILVHERQRLTARTAAPPSADASRVADLMTPAVFSVTPDAPARQVVEQLLGLQVQQLFVVDDTGALVGSISARDVVRHLV